ncbi:MAG: hypothetical protein D6677_12250 [Calditrichaeota bacterium]|nr:MAG: hypothetical protein D6677_12250 [Calditrichota bacterium]
MNDLQMIRNILSGHIRPEQALFSFPVHRLYIQLLAELVEIDTKESTEAGSLVHIDRMLTAYWEGTLPAEDLQKFKGWLMHDDRLAGLFVRRMKDHSRMLRTEKTQKNKKTKHIHIRRDAWRWLLPLAAVLTGFLFWPSDSLRDRLNFQDTPPLAFNSTIMRGNNELSTSEEKIFIQGIKAYLACDYDNALIQWSRLDPKTALRKNVWFYKALSHVALASDKRLPEKIQRVHARQAVHLFQKNLHPDNETEIYFYVLALLLNGEPDAAREWVSRIHSVEIKKRLDILSNYF